jgi:c-di-GMP-binding flagellar brake protein YcgR
MKSDNLTETADSVAAPVTPRRSSYRTRAEIPAALALDTDGAGWLRCWLRDLSTTGASIEGTLELGLGERLRLRFGKPGDRFTLPATVIRGTTKARVFGVRFDPLSESESHHLYQFVMELAQEYVEYRARHLSWEPAGS